MIWLLIVIACATGLFAVVAAHARVVRSEVLRVLTETRGPLTGLQIVDHIARKGFSRVWLTGAVYPALRQLEDEGWLVVRSVATSPERGRRPRNTYELRRLFDEGLHPHGG